MLWNKHWKLHLDLENKLLLNFQNRKSSDGIAGTNITIALQSTKE